jgi:hypothetical protein
VTSTLKFKVVNESVKKTDRHDAATIAEFGLKSCLPLRFLGVSPRGGDRALRGSAIAPAVATRRLLRTPPIPCAANCGLFLPNCGNTGGEASGEAVIASGLARHPGSRHCEPPQERSNPARRQPWGQPPRTRPCERAHYRYDGWHRRTGSGSGTISRGNCRTLL